MNCLNVQGKIAQVTYDRLVDSPSKLPSTSF